MGDGPQDDASGRPKCGTDVLPRVVPVQLGPVFALAMGRPLPPDAAPASRTGTMDTLIELTLYVFVVIWSVLVAGSCWIWWRDVTRADRKGGRTAVPEDTNPREGRVPARGTSEDERLRSSTV